ncbi:hypothetical protein [Marinobacter sp. SS21]|uniref:hypothetical protein n=1 Tax=Marinobacter sp. SS21 TaxID=2979460 RepID=UPI00232AABDC|nr:hypothetical protein [Marinobacter sp. SS21]MDC0662072.1 hypothetical protein [Marinobacter sp. SS21]
MTTPAVAKDYSLLFGGGPSPERTEFSIESNVLWFDTLFERAGFDGATTVFGSGGRNAKEIHYLAPVDVTEPHAALALVFDSAEVNSRRFRASEVRSEPPTPLTRDGLASQLNRHIGALGEGDSLLLTYSGHGGKGQRPQDNFLFLWDNTAMSVDDMQRSLLEADQGATIRFVLPQCFSGAFTRLPFRNMNPQEGVIKGPEICGFTSVSDDQLSEGCTASVNSEDFRDYASFFYGAISGSDRRGQPLDGDADMDASGRVSLREAHLYTLGHVISTDIPRSTSEEYLLAVEPWSQRWASYRSASADNEFIEVAERLAYDFENRVGEHAFLKETSKRLLQQSASVTRGEQAVSHTRGEIHGLQHQLREQLFMRWPELSAPYTEAYHRVVSSELGAIETWLRQWPEFNELAEAQQRYDHLVFELIEQQRQLARLQRIQRMLKLGRLHDYAMHEGDVRMRQDYLALRACEDWEIPQER